MVGVNGGGRKQGMDFRGVAAGILAVLAVIGLTVWTAVRPGTRKPGATGAAGAFGAVEQVFAPVQYEARLEVERQHRAQAPAPLARGQGPGGAGARTGRKRVSG
jgi:hypothetical protein